MAVVDDEPGALAEPLAFAVEFGSDKKPRPKLLRLPSWTGGVEPTTDDLTITVPLPATAPTRVIALVADNQVTHLLAGEIPAGRNYVKLPVTLAGDTAYGVLVLVAGWAGLLERVDVA